MSHTNWFIKGFEKLTGETWAGATLNGAPVTADKCREALIAQVMSNTSNYFGYALSNEQSDIVHAAEWLVRNASRTDTNFFNSLRNQFAANGRLSYKQINCCKFRGK